jgi:hypothetical protein
MVAQANSLSLLQGGFLADAQAGWRGVSGYSVARVDVRPSANYWMFGRNIPR